MNETRQKLYNSIQNINSDNFDVIALNVFKYQSQFNPLYAQFISLLGLDRDSIQHVSQIPFLPIALFKSQIIKTGNWPEECIFSSSGTTGGQASKHFVRNLGQYLHNTVKGFNEFYGNTEDYCFLALLPSYLERTGSSLVDMVAHFIKKSKYGESGFYLNNYEELLNQIKICQSKSIPTILIGVSFALLDLAEIYQADLSNIIVMETGGMKGRRKELTRSELHQALKSKCNINVIHSEYGMTELLSQAYSKGEGRFFSSATMRVQLRSITDPFEKIKMNRSGLINIIDLANIDSCSFIATDDIGLIHGDGSFEVLGRLDGSDLRGCNLLLGEV